jgi:hypothetical protein
MLRSPIVLVIVFLAATSRADECTDLLAQPGALSVDSECGRRLLRRALDHSLSLEQLSTTPPDRHTALAMRNAGIALTVVGVVASVTGAVLVAKELCLDHCDKGWGDSEQRFYGELSLLVLGQVSAISGIPLWATGQARVNAAERAKLSLAASGARLTF